MRMCYRLLNTFITFSKRGLRQKSVIPFYFLDCLWLWSDFLTLALFLNTLGRKENYPIGSIEKGY